MQRQLAADDRLPTIELKSAGLHPLVYRKRMASVDREAKAGDLVRVLDADGRHVGFGLYNPRSELVLRMLSREQQPPDESWWHERLSKALELRRKTLKLEDVTDSYRLVHAEADGLSGLVVDKLGDVLSLECFSSGMYERAEAIVNLFAPLAGTSHYLIRGGPATIAQEGFEGAEIASPDLPKRITIQEFGTRFRVDFASGHKTGFFCDQRDNRRLLASFCRDRTVLDLCCYTGGFAVQAKKLGGAKDVVGVDLDAEPLELAKENANLNQVRIKFAQADAFAYIRDMQAGERQFDVVVLDPPKLIRSRAELEEGTRKHFDLNRLAMRLVAPGGIMATFTCSGLLSHEEFRRIVYASARQAGRQIEAATIDRGARHALRDVQILAHTGAAADHPIAAHCPETEYLQGIFMRVL
jgi:23S rRNA (cytosine1962-C5)-methyltransferase